MSSGVAAVKISQRISSLPAHIRDLYLDCPGVSQLAGFVFCCCNLSPWLTIIEMVNCHFATRNGNLISEFIRNQPCEAPGRI